MAETRKRAAVTERLWAAVGWPGFPPQSLIIPTLVVGGVARMAGRREAAWQLAALGIIPLGEAVKRLVPRPRPPTDWVRLGRRQPRSSSFPSTHVATYTAAYGYTAVVLGSRQGAVRWLASLPIGLIALVGPSRLREGDHWRTDVVAGYVLGGSYLSVLLALRWWSRNKPGPEPGSRTRRDRPDALHEPSRGRAVTATAAQRGDASGMPQGLDGRRHSHPD